MVRVRSTSVQGPTAAEIRAEGVDLLFLVWLISRATTDVIDTALGPSQLTADEYAIYSILSAAGSITPTELARWMATAPTTVSSYVKRFEVRGHVTRTPNPDDRRSYHISLTGAGRQAHRRAALLFKPARDRVEQALADRGEIAEALLSLHTALDQVRHPPAP